MAANPEKIALYLQGTFSQANPNDQQKQDMLNAAADIAQSGFGTVIMGQWHVHSDGTLYYNDSALDTVSWAMQNIPKALKQGGNVKQVFITFGPFGSDFGGIQNNLSKFKTDIIKLQAASGIDGLDWDLEQDYSTYSNLLVNLTQWANTNGMRVTAAPYQEHSVWTSILKSTNGGKSQGFEWWNLQLYSGQTNYSDWVGYLQGLVPDPAAFLLPGYKVANGYSPSDVQQGITQLRQTYPSINGGFLWKYEAIPASGYSTKEYASAIAAALK